MASEFTRRGMLLGAGALAGGGLLVGCSSEKQENPAAPVAGGEGPQKGKKVIFVVHDKNPFFAPVQQGFEMFAASMGWDAQFTGPPAQDVPKTVQLQQSALNANPAGVIFTRIDPTAFDANIRRAKDDGVRIVLSNVASPGYEKLGVAFVGQDFVPAGEVCGREVARYAQERTGKTSGLIVAGNFAPGNYALEERIQGIERGVAAANRENGTSYTTEVLVTSTDEPKAIAGIDAKYTREGDGIVGWAMAAFDHQFVGTWAKQKNLTGEFGVGGFDLVQPVLDGIKEGTIDFSIGQNPYAQGWIAGALLAMEIDPGFPARDYDTGAEVVDASNIDAVIEREARFS